jgi:hypothetical protein
VGLSQGRDPKEDKQSATTHRTTTPNEQGIYKNKEFLNSSDDATIVDGNMDGNDDRVSVSISNKSRAEGISKQGAKLF